MSDDNFDYSELRFDDGDSDDGIHADSHLSKSSKKGGKGSKSDKPDRLQKLSDAIGDFNRVTGVLQRMDQEYVPALGEFNKKLEVVLVGLAKKIADLMGRMNGQDSRLTTISSSIESEARDTRTTVKQTVAELGGRVDTLVKKSVEERSFGKFVLFGLAVVMAAAIYAHYRLESKVNDLSVAVDSVKTQAAKQSLSGKAFLTIDEVLDYSGLPIDVFRKAVADKKLVVYMVPNGKEVGERFRRSDVDKFLRDYKP
jgi:hypothetical protein